MRNSYSTYSTSSTYDHRRTIDSFYAKQRNTQIDVDIDTSATENNTEAYSVNNERLERNLVRSTIAAGEGISYNPDYENLVFHPSFTTQNTQSFALNTHSMTINTQSAYIPNASQVLESNQENYILDDKNANGSEDGYDLNFAANEKRISIEDVQSISEYTKKNDEKSSVHEKPEGKSRLWYIGIGVSAVIVLSIVGFFTLGPAIAQSMVNSSTMTLTQTSMKNVQENSFELTATGTVSTMAGIADGKIFVFNFNIQFSHLYSYSFSI
jgi:hypothetical protein